MPNENSAYQFVNMKETSLKTHLYLFFRTYAGEVVSLESSLQIRGICGRITNEWTN